MQSGFGRIGKMFAYEHYDIVPDLIACGKGISSSLPLQLNVSCFHKGLLMFAPVSIEGECIKIAPPLNITPDALLESLDVFGEACDEVLI